MNGILCSWEGIYLGDVKEFSFIFFLLWGKLFFGSNSADDESSRILINVRTGILMHKNEDTIIKVMMLRRNSHKFYPGIDNRFIITLGILLKSGNSYHCWWKKKIVVMKILWDDQEHRFAFNINFSCGQVKCLAFIYLNWFAAYVSPVWPNRYHKIFVFVFWYCWNRLQDRIQG